MAIRLGTEGLKYQVPSFGQISAQRSAAAASAGGSASASAYVANRRYAMDKKQLLYSVQQAAMDRDFRAQQAELGREFEAEQSQLGREYGAEQSQLGRKHDARMAREREAFATSRQDDQLIADHYATLSNQLDQFTKAAGGYYEDTPEAQQFKKDVLQYQHNLALAQSNPRFRQSEIYRMAIPKLAGIVGRADRGMIVPWDKRPGNISTDEYGRRWLRPTDPNEPSKFMGYAADLTPEQAANLESSRKQSIAIVNGQAGQYVMDRYGERFDPFSNVNSQRDKLVKDIVSSKGASMGGFSSDDEYMKAYIEAGYIADRILQSNATPGSIGLPRTTVAPAQQAPALPAPTTSAPSVPAPSPVTPAPAPTVAPSVTQPTVSSRQPAGNIGSMYRGGQTEGWGMSPGAENFLRELAPGYFEQAKPKTTAAPSQVKGQTPQAVPTQTVPTPQIESDKLLANQIAQQPNFAELVRNAQPVSRGERPQPGTIVLVPDSQGNFYPAVAGQHGVIRVGGAVKAKQPPRTKTQSEKKSEDIWNTVYGDVSRAGMWGM